jgi:hypothetical protein
MLVADLRTAEVGGATRNAHFNLLGYPARRFADGGK